METIKIKYFSDEIERLEKRIHELESDNSNLKAQIDRMRD